MPMMFTTGPLGAAVDAGATVVVVAVTGTDGTVVVGTVVVAGGTVVVAGTVDVGGIVAGATVVVGDGIDDDGVVESGPSDDALASTRLSRSSTIDGEGVGGMTIGSDVDATICDAAVVAGASVDVVDSGGTVGGGVAGAATGLLTNTV